MIIVSLTTIPPRFKYLFITIDSILNQTIKPDKIVINIPEKYNNFSYDSLPNISSDIVIIHRQTKDYGPATKLLGLYSLDLYDNMNNEDIIIVIDDDRVYNNKLIENMLDYHSKYKNEVLTVAGWEIEMLTNNLIKTHNKKKPRGIEFKQDGYIDILGGCCGFLMTKKMCPFHYKEIFEVNPNDEIYYVDDILISGFLKLNNVDIRLIPNCIFRDEKRSINDSINPLYDGKRQQKNINSIQYLKDKFHIWN